MFWFEDINLYYCVCMLPKWSQKLKWTGRLKFRKKLFGKYREMRLSSKIQKWQRLIKSSVLAGPKQGTLKYTGCGSVNLTTRADCSHSGKRQCFRSHQSTLWKNSQNYSPLRISTFSWKSRQAAQSRWGGQEVRHGDGIENLVSFQNIRTHAD